MDTSITQKQYQQLLERQDHMENQLKTLSALVREQIPEEVREDYKVKLDKWHNEIMQGKGKSFSSLAAFRRYCKSLT